MTGRNWPPSWRRSPAAVGFARIEPERPDRALPVLIGSWCVACAEGPQRVTSSRGHADLLVTGEIRSRPDPGTNRDPPEDHHEARSDLQEHAMSSHPVPRRSRAASPRSYRRGQAESDPAGNGSLRISSSICMWASWSSGWAKPILDHLGRDRLPGTPAGKGSPYAYSASLSTVSVQPEAGVRLHDHERIRANLSFSAHRYTEISGRLKESVPSLRLRLTKCTSTPVETRVHGWAGRAASSRMASVRVTSAVFGRPLGRR